MANKTEEILFDRLDFELSNEFRLEYALKKPRHIESPVQTSNPVPRQVEANFSGDDGFIAFSEEEEEAGKNNFEAIKVVGIGEDEEEGEMLEPVKADSQPPWIDENMSSIHVKSHFLRLHQEIIDFCDFMAPTKAEIKARSKAIERVTDVLKKIWNDIEVKVFGSYATGLFLPTSDIDMVILGATYGSTIEALRAMANALRRDNIGTKIEVVGKAKVPIVKFVETQSNIAFDISLDMENGPDAALLIKAAMAELPQLKPLCLVVKIYLLQRELNEVYTGGIGSYALIIMIIAHLQLHPSRRRKGKRMEKNLGILLADFFQLYGKNLNFHEVGVSCRNGGKFFSKRLHRPEFVDHMKPYLLSVEDPQAEDNDLCRNSRSIFRVRDAFAWAHKQLTTPFENSSVGILGRIIRMDSAVVNRAKPTKKRK